MKKSDWALIILIVAVVGVASYFIVGAIMPSPAEELQSVPIANDITDTVIEPSKSVFSGNAINPTVRVEIGNQGENAPFDIRED